MFQTGIVEHVVPYQSIIDIDDIQTVGFTVVEGALGDFDGIGAHCVL